MFLLIAKHEGKLSGIQAKQPAWHASLPKAMSMEGADSIGVIDARLRNRLVQYMGFRHVFRHAYLHQIDWDRLKPLIQHLDDTVIAVESQIHAYLAKK